MPPVVTEWLVSGVEHMPFAQRLVEKCGLRQRLRISIAYPQLTSFLPQISDFFKKSGILCNTCLVSKCRLFKQQYREEKIHHKN